MRKLFWGMLIFTTIILNTNCRNSNISKIEDKEKKSNYGLNFMMSERLNSASKYVNSEVTPTEKLIDEMDQDIVRKYQMELLMTGEYHGEDIEIKAGRHKGWMGLYKNKGKYFLLPTAIKVKIVPDFMYADEVGKKVSSNINLPNVFLLKKANMLRQGEVKTLFYGEEENSEDINVNYRRNFEFKGIKYTLFVNEPNEKADWLTEKSTMILRVGNKQQMIYQQGGCNDCSWDLCWVGDLDKDGKLDFMLNLTSHYNVTSHSLFLSSQAKKGEIVH